MDEVSTTITILLVKEIYKSATPFSNYEKEKSRITTDLKTTSMIRKKNKIFKKLKERFWEGGDEDKEEELAQAPLALIQG